MASPEELERMVGSYARRRGISIEIEFPLGFGQDGVVFRSNRKSAVKVLERRRNHQYEVAAYQRLAEFGISSLGTFDVPRLIDHDDELRIVEIGIVSPPYLLDFGKAYVDRPSPYTARQLADHLDECQDLFHEADWPAVEFAVLELKLRGIGCSRLGSSCFHLV